MKSKRLPKLLAALASLLMIVVAVVCVTAFAGEDDPATIKKINISYDGAVRIVYEVERNSTDVEPVILVWEDDVTGEKTVENASYQIKDYGIYQYGEDYVGTKFDGVYFLSNGFAPKDLKRPISAAVAVEKDGALVFNNKEIATLSIFDYVIKRFENATATKDQKALYTSLLNYGGAVQAVLYEGYLNDGKTEAEAAELAGLKYGYADAYVGVRYYETAMVKGEAKNSTPTVNYYRAADDIFVTAPVTYMGRPFAGFVDKNGEQFAGSTASRYTTVNVDEPSITDVVATYKRATGTAEVPVTTIDKFTLDRNYSSTVTVTALPGGGIAFDKPVKTQDLDGKTGNSNPSVSITPTNTARTDNWYIAADADISFPEIYDGCTKDGFAYVLFSAGAYGYRLNIQRTESNIVTFSTALENRYTPYFVIKGGFDADGISNESEKLIKRTTWKVGTTTKYGGSIYTNPVQGENDGFADKSIHLDDLKNLRIEMHPENEKLVDYNYIVVIDKDGDVTTTEDQTSETRTAQVKMPEVRLYVNGEYWGSTYYAYYASNNADARSLFTYTIYEDATDDYFVTPYHKARTENTKLSLGKFTTTFMGAGIANIHLNNVTYGTYDYEGRFYDAYYDLNSTGHYDYENVDHVTAGRLEVKNAEETVFKSADGKYYKTADAAGEGAVEYKFTWQKYVYGSPTEAKDGYFLTKHTQLISVTQNGVEQLDEEGKTFEGLAKGDIIPRYWLKHDGCAFDWGGSNTSLLNKPAQTVYPSKWNADVFVWESDFNYSTTDVASGHVEGTVSSNGKRVFAMLFDVTKNGEIVMRERKYQASQGTNTGNTESFDSAVIGRVGETFNLRFEFVVNSYTDNAENRIYVYSNNVLVLTCDSFADNAPLKYYGIDQVTFYFPNTPRDVTITLTNTYATRYVPAPTAENNYELELDADKNVSDYNGITHTSNITADSTAETAVDSAYLYIDTVNGENVLRYGKVNKTGENHLYFAVPENKLNYCGKLVFSTQIWISSGLSANKDDFIRFVLVEKEGGKQADGGVNQFVFNPVAATTGEKVDYVLASANKNADRAVLKQDQWNSIMIEYDAALCKSNVYVNGVLVMQMTDRWSKFVSTDVNYVSVEMRGSSGDLKNVHLMLKDIEIGYTKEKIITQKVIDYTNSSDLASINNESVANAKFPVGGGNHITGSLYGKDDVYSMFWKYSQDVNSKNVSHAPNLYFFNNGVDAEGDDVTIPFSVPGENTRYVFETDIYYNQYVFNEKTHQTDYGPKTDTEGRYYDGWINYFNIVDARDTGDSNAVGTVQTTYNSRTGVFKLGKQKIEFEKWYHVRVVITSTATTENKNTITWEVYLDDVKVGEGTNTKNYVTGEVLGFRIKCKDISYFSEGGIAFANTTVTEYKISD